MPELQVDWPKEDLQALSKQIHRAQDLLGKDIEKSVTWAAYYVARSASTRTDKSAKTRALLPNPGGQKGFPRRRFPYYREVWRGRKGPSDPLRWFLESADDTRYEKIVRSGLAKKSWLWMLPAIRRNASFSNSAIETHKRGSAFGIEIEISNKLHYIRQALKVGRDGEPLLIEAAGKAASAMEKAIDRRQKAMKR